MATLTQAMEEALASAPVDRILIETIELTHPSFTTETGALTGARIVKDNFPFRGKIETNATVDPGAVVRYEPLMFTFSPPSSTSGELPFIAVSIDNVDNVLSAWADAAARDPRPVRVIYRPYLFYPESDMIDAGVRVAGPNNTPSNIRTSEWDPPIRMTVSNIVLERAQVSFQARPIDFINNRFPSELVTKARFPAI